MKRTFALTALIAASISTTLVAQEGPAYENWVGGFAGLYNADSDKPEPNGYLDDGRLFGGELGFRFDPKWAVRFEASRILLDTYDARFLGFGDDGTQIGVDAMYFLNNDVAYLFGGFRQQSIQDTYRMASYGVGKHWLLKDKFRLITEAAGYYDFGQGHNEFSLKLGLAYMFGGSGSSANAAKDSDSDGVYDAVDRCANSPKGQPVDATGCSVDLDNDGVLNSVDQCPNTPAGVTVNANGCAIKDADSDGVLDNVDSCLNTAPGVEVNSKGCAIDLDLDNDGVLDAQDNCPNTPMTDKVTADGCSVLLEKEVEITLNVLFGNNSSIVSNPNATEIVEFAEFMNRYGNTSAVIEGHSSAVGEADYNLMLSTKRANAILTLLINEYDIEASRLSAEGYGETRLKNTSNTAAAHKVNRRIEVSVKTTVTTKAER